MKRRVTWAVVALVVIAVGTAMAIAVPRLPDRGDTTPTARVMKGALKLTVHATGELRAGRTMTLVAPPVGGMLRIVNLVPTGGAVKSGDTVMEFDPADQQYALEQARSELEEAEQGIVKMKADSTVQVAQDQVALLTARFDVRRAELDVSGSEFYSAIDSQKHALSLEEAKRRLAQLDEDVKSRSVTNQASLAVSEERRNKARLAMQRAQQIIESLVMRAPIDGVVSLKENRDASGGFFFFGMVLPEYRQGDSVWPGRPVADVIESGRMEVRAKVDENDRANLTSGQPAAIYVDTLPGSTFKGRVGALSELAARANWFESSSSNRNFDITFQFDQPDPRLKAGSSARVVIDGKEVADALHVPRQAVFDKNGKNHVFVKVGDRFEQREVQVVQRTESRVAVSGLAAGTEVALVDPSSTARLVGIARFADAGRGRAGEMKASRIRGSTSDFLPDLRLGLENLRAHTLRSLLTMLGMIFGVAAVVAMLSIGAGAQQEVMAFIEQLGVRNLIVEAREAPDQQALQKVRKLSSGLSFRDFRMIEANLEGITASSARKRFTPSKLLPRPQGDPPMVYGVSPGYIPIANLKTVSGRFFDAAETAGAAPVAVLGEAAAASLFGVDDPIGRHVKVNEQWFQVIGVAGPQLTVQSDVGGLPAQDRNNLIYVPLYSAIFRLEDGQSRQKDEIDGIYLQVQSSDNIAAAAALLRGLLNVSHREAGDFTIVSPAELLAEQRRTQRIFELVMVAIASISLLVGGIGIMNIMLASVMERTREIGIRRAIGARRSDVVRQFLIETTIISLTGGLVGIIVGVGLSQAIGYLAGWSTIVTTSSIVLAFFVSVSIGLVFGLYPAMRAARLDPVTALHYTNEL